MNQTKRGNPFGRLMEFAKPHKTGYVVSVILAVVGVALGMVPYFATAEMIIHLLNGNREISFYAQYCLIGGGAFVGKAVFMGISTKVSHETTFAVMSEARRRIAGKLSRVPMGYLIATPSGQLKNGMVERMEPVSYTHLTLPTTS